MMTEKFDLIKLNAWALGLLCMLLVACGADETTPAEAEEQASEALSTTATKIEQDLAKRLERVEEDFDAYAEDIDGVQSDERQKELRKEANQLNEELSAAQEDLKKLSAIEVSERSDSWGKRQSELEARIDQLEKRVTQFSSKVVEHGFQGDIQINLQDDINSVREDLGRAEDYLQYVPGETGEELTGELKSSNEELLSLEEKVADLGYSSSSKQWRQKARSHREAIRELRIAANELEMKAENALIQENSRVADRFQTQIEELRARQASYAQKLDQLEAEAQDPAGDSLVQIEEALNTIQENVNDLAAGNILDPQISLRDEIRSELKSIEDALDDISTTYELFGEDEENNS